MPSTAFVLGNGGLTLRTLLCSAVLVLSVPALAADDVAKQVSAKLTPFKTLHASFTEEKKVEGLTRPLKSTGRLAYERTLGLLWRVEKPLASETVMTPTKLVQKVKGRVTLNLNVAAQPSMQVISRLFLASLTGDWAALDADFAMTGELEAGGLWKLHLKPKGGLFAKIAKTLELSGGKAITQVVLNELSGDTTTTTFDDHVFDAPLTADEEARFVTK